MVDTILKIVLAALSIWESKEKTKYQDRVLELRKRYYEENAKPAGERNDAALDFWRFELLSLADSIAAEIARSHAAS